MTRQEAIETLKVAKAEIEWEYPMDFQVALDMAIESLESKESNKAYIKDLTNGEVREYGLDCHDSLRVSPDGNYLTYYNLQNGDGSHGNYRFVEDTGETPEELTERTKVIEYATNCYFNIGGW